MTWYVMSMNQVNGTMSGAFSDLDSLYLKGKIVNLPANFEWTSWLSEAQSFETSEEARTFVNNNWGAWFADRVFGIVEILDADERTEKDNKIYMQKRLDLKTRLILSSEEVTLDELGEMASQYYNSGLSWFEAHLIKTVRRLSDSK